MICPNCNYCPHCGRSNARPLQPIYPYQVVPYTGPFYELTIKGKLEHFKLDGTDQSPETVLC